MVEPPHHRASRSRPQTGWQRVPTIRVRVLAANERPLLVPSDYASESLELGLMESTGASRRKPQIVQ
jgi:hypothetical protein